MSRVQALIRDESKHDWALKEYLRHKANNLRQGLAERLESGEILNAQEPYCDFSNDVPDFETLSLAVSYTHGAFGS